jgi:hypothetical protein
MQRQAGDLLRMGQCEHAGTLFAFAVLQRGDDPSAWNNLEFCKIPADSSAALFHLERAADLGYRHMSVNIHNRLISHLTLGHETIARNLAEE